MTENLDIIRRRQHNLIVRIGTCKSAAEVANNERLRLKLTIQTDTKHRAVRQHRLL